MPVTVRVTTPKGAATRTRILDAATVLFHQNGVVATGLDEVLAASGSGKSQFYHHFGGGKATLVDDVIDAQTDRIVGWHTALLAEVTDIGGLRGWADSVVAAVATRRGAYGCPLGSLAAELSDRSDAHRVRVAQGFARWEEILTAAVQRVTGEAASAADLAAVLLTALQGGLLLAEATRDVRYLRLALDGAIAAVAAGATPRRTGSRQRRGSLR